MTSVPTRHALYFPFHLCHERTLQQLMSQYASIHFRDFMALQLTPMSGTTAYEDRMGDAYPDLVKAGRIVQGYAVSGPLDQEMIAAVNRDLSDGAWRSLFHRALVEDRRFQRGLFDLSHGVVIGGRMVPGPAALLRLIEDARTHQMYTVDMLQRTINRSDPPAEAYQCEYGLALIKTSAALQHTIRLAIRHHLEAVTDSEPHYRLLARTCVREHASVVNEYIVRDAY